MRAVVGVVSWVMLPIAVVVVAFQCAMDFVEEAVINNNRRK